MLKEKLMEDLKEAMKEKEVLKKNVVQMIRAAILQVEKDKQIELNDDQILEIIAKEAKKRKESLADYEKSGREDLINQVKEEIEIINKYLPEQMEKEETSINTFSSLVTLSRTSIVVPLFAICANCELVLFI